MKIKINSVLNSARLTILIVLLFGFKAVLAQEGVPLEVLFENTPPVEVRPVTYYFKDGTIKEEGVYHTYEVNDVWYDIPVQTFRQYYSDGGLMHEEVYDDYGNLIRELWYDGSGFLESQIEMISIKTYAQTLFHFFEIREFTINISRLTYYGYNSKECKPYIKKSGRLKNYEKIGDWYYYKNDGSLRRIKKFKISKD